MPESQPPPQLQPNQVARLLGLGHDRDDATQTQTAAEGPLGVGATIDRFTIEAELGRGGMGVVYRALDRQLERHVALKVLGPQIAGDPAAAKRFVYEAQLAAQLDHPHVVRILELDDREPPRYFVMELVPGQSLREAVAQAGYFAPQRAVHIARQVCEALAHAHAKHIVHRDIKPGNILLENHIERVRIADFGIAKELTGAVGAPTQTVGPAPGTAPFMSPEQLRGEKADCRSDIYAFGVTLYYMLTGRLPYEAGSREGFARAAVHQRPACPSRFNADVAEDLDRIVLKMIAVEPGKRYQDCEALGRELSALSGTQVQASPWSRVVRRLTRAARKSTWIVAFLLLAVLAVWATLRLADAVRQAPLAPAVPAAPAAATAPAPVEPAAIKVDSPLVTVFDRTGRSVWLVRVQGVIVKAELAQLEPGRPAQLVIGVGAVGADAGKVLVYDAEGRLRWSHDTAEPGPYRAGVNRVTISDLLVADLWGNGRPQIVAVSRDLEWFPSKVTVFDGEGKVRRTYWHPGQLLHALAFKSSGDARMRIVAWGCNNDLLAAGESTGGLQLPQGVVCLDPETMSGEAPPRRGRIGQGVEDWYVRLLPRGLEIEGVVVSPPQPGAPEGARGQTLEVRVSGERFLSLDEHGQVVGHSDGNNAAGGAPPELKLVR